jgi:hypothetical protein
MRFLSHALGVLCLVRRYSWLLVIARKLSEYLILQQIIVLPLCWLATRNFAYHTVYVSFVRSFQLDEDLLSSCNVKRERLLFPCSILLRALLTNVHLFPLGTMAYN